jgi:hypothetical protein
MLLACDFTTAPDGAAVKTAEPDNATTNATEVTAPLRDRNFIFVTFISPPLEVWLIVVCFGTSFGLEKFRTASSLHSLLAIEVPLPN